jgi:hypothetical protein
MRLATSLLALLVALGIPSLSAAAPVTWIFSGHVTDVPDYTCEENWEVFCEPYFDLSAFVKVGDPWTLRLQFDPTALTAYGEDCTLPQARLSGPMTGSLRVNGSAPVSGGIISFGIYVNLSCPGGDDAPSPNFAELTLFVGPTFSGIPHVDVGVFRLYTGFPSPFSGTFQVGLHWVGILTYSMAPATRGAPTCCGDR